jgi:hypothetical protein
MMRPAKDQSAAIARYFVETPAADLPGMGHPSDLDALAVMRRFPGASIVEMQRGCDIAAELLAADQAASTLCVARGGPMEGEDMDGERPVQGDR